MTDPARRRRRPAARAAAAAAALTLVAPLAACGSGGDGGTPTINLYYPPEQNLQKVVDDCNTQAQGRYRIAYRVLPRQADDQRVQLVRRLAAGDTGMDVLGLDVTWTQEFASADWIREWTGPDRAEVEEGTLAGPLDTARYQDKLYGAPKNTNVQLLWYRTDLVPEAPKTWDDMIRQAQDLKAQGKPYQVLTMGAQYEGLVVLYNTLAESAGGRILSDDGKQAVMDAGTVTALDQLRRFATSGVTSPSFSNATEDPVRLEFQSGNGAFQVNWPFVYPALQEADPELAKKVKWARIPGIDADTPSKVTIGGVNLAVSAYSRHPAESFEAAKCLRNARNQKFSAVNDGVPPTIERVYDDPEMTEAYPMKETILEELKEPATRPLTPAYQSISTVMSAILSPPSAIRPERTADELRDAIADALESKGVLP
ncbi:MULTISPECIES: ABC transporter substrate-binding protein [Micromonospora]|uniref:ABC transporter substrate-binding protein n=1 Tax=Micromonospora carbonacea TaxID=47853 RepID=A0A7H8XRB6_9ACTN|nr:MULTISPECIES: ABC transporter substrate-binding protein [Micromonospora]MBB5825526.1 multiple sugar transport system substrate-binding protein [Micromonospora carbonacea]QLD26432.1 ABC transporter substrate-binding protein [Micromonospora carbonacea]WFE56899.1 ABC transporter substrate-binding protein [Micromonospora sp. WMMD712]